VAAVRNGAFGLIALTLWCVGRLRRAEPHMGAVAGAVVVACLIWHATERARVD
jgi:hypothetical protein